MKILQVAPLWESVPPAAYGGTEAVVHLLTEGLVRRGHEVTLCASGDSRTSARLQACYPHSLRTANGIKTKSLYSWQHSALALRDAREYDIIHNHAGEEVMALSHLVPDIPMLTTMHCLITPDAKFIWDRYAGYYNTISWGERRSMPETGGIFAGVVYNGIDAGSFPFRAEKDDYLLFLARMSPEKGPLIAIEVARRTGKRLIMAGKVDDQDYNFFLSSVAPLIDGEQIRYVGEADGAMKRELYRDAFCVLTPIIWEEPFGLVLAEAQACGTPVVSFGRGAAPEIVRHEVTGFIAENAEEMAEAVLRVREIDPLACRLHVQRNFDVPVMVENYIRTYEAILQGRVLAKEKQASAPASAPPDIRSVQVA